MRRPDQRRNAASRYMAQDISEYTIQEAAARLGIPLQKLRRWDAQGVLVARRTNGGHRRYAREIIDGLAGSTSVTGEDKIDFSQPEKGGVGDKMAAARRTF